jgi:hypothetical protein
MPVPALESDSPPVLPVRPDNGECCQGGCARCIFDWYDEAMERYETELREWRARHLAVSRADAPPEGDGRISTETAEDAGKSKGN